MILGIKGVKFNVDVTNLNDINATYDKVSVHDLRQYMYIEYIKVYDIKLYRTHYFAYDVAANRYLYIMVDGQMIINPAYTAHTLIVEKLTSLYYGIVDEDFENKLYHLNNLTFSSVTARRNLIQEFKNSLNG